MEEFVATHYVTGNMAVAGVGVDHDTLTELVKKMPVHEGPKPTVMQKATYHGGDVSLLITFCIFLMLLSETYGWLSK